MLRYSLASAGLVGLISGALPNPAYASDTAMQNPLAIERSAGTTVFAENKTKLKKVHLNNVILKGYDPVAYFTQGKAVMGNPLITSTYNGVLPRLMRRAKRLQPCHDIPDSHIPHLHVLGILR